jgi:exopolyphosphatase / guanosine-5'-triphosphate,3'-diphosphate pyrophosphatase
VSARKIGLQKMSRASDAPRRLDHGPPIAVVDIGSNSVRLVVYDGLARSATALFNEKVLCGLGREVQTTGLLAADAVEQALSSLKRYRALCSTIGVKKVLAIATAACRDAKNGRAFISLAERIVGADIDVLSGPREAELTALGVISGVHQADGVVGDLGGGSLELVDVHGTRTRRGLTRPLGGLALADISAKSLKKAEKYVKKTLAAVPTLRNCEGRTFYAVGGTWRALARLHMWQTGYPLHVVHGYTIPADDALEFARLVHRVDVGSLSNIEVVNSARRPLLAYAALVLEYVLRIGKPRQVMFSALGVREGLVYSMLKRKDREKDALIEAARDLNRLRSRSPRHGEELVDWTDRFMASSGLDEPREERRLRHAACLLADIGWRAHPDYRGEQSLNIIAHGGFTAIDHPGRAYLALAVFYRHVGLVMDEELSPRLRELASTRMIDRARILGTAMRLAYVISAAMPGVLPKTCLGVERHRLALRLPGEFAALGGERVVNRLRALCRVIGREPVMLLG